MSSLLLRYRERLGDKGINADSYSKQRLKLCLQKHFGDNIVSHQYPDKSKPEIIYSRAISVQDVLNAAAQNTVLRSEKKASKILDDDNQLLNVTRRIKEDIRKCKGITLRPLNVDDVSLESAGRIVPRSLYSLILLLILPDGLGKDFDFDKPFSGVKTEDDRRVLSIAQDIIHCASNARRVKLPKQTGLQ